jgi:hypothetical protein
MQKHRAETATFGSADVQVVVGIAEHDPRRYFDRAARGRLLPPPTPSRTAAWGVAMPSTANGRPQAGPHPISDSTIAKTAGIGEATGKAVKGCPLSAAFVMGKICLAGLWQSIRGATRARGTGRS